MNKVQKLVKLLFFDTNLLKKEGLTLLFGLSQDKFKDLIRMENVNPDELYRNFLSFWNIYCTNLVNFCQALRRLTSLNRISLYTRYPIYQLQDYYASLEFPEEFRILYDKIKDIINND